MLKGTHMEEDCLLQCFTGQVVSACSELTGNPNRFRTTDLIKEAHNYVVRGSNTS